MKPDKHKKEKNAIYKKKHGITDDNKQEQKKNNQIRDTKANAKADPFGVVPHTAGTPTSNVSDDRASKKHGHSNKPGLEAYPNSSEKPQLETKETNYQRRKVVSNWERYKAEENTTPTLRGSDFATLLNSSASVISYSQYRDELGLTNAEDSKQNTSVKLLTLDCDDLASSLMCVPLHQRLAVEDCVFEPVMLQQFFELSKESASKYTRAWDKMQPSPVATSDYISTDTSDNNVEAQITAVSHDPLFEISGQECSGHLLKEDGCGNSLVKASSSIAEDSTSSSELSSESQHNIQISTEISLTETVRQPESEVRNETCLPLPSSSASSVKDKVVNGTKCGPAQSKQSLKELENELDTLLGL